MSKRSLIFAAVLGVLALGGAVRADMMPVSSSDAGSPQPLSARLATEQPGLNPFTSLNSAGIADLGLPPAPSLPRTESEAGQVCDTQPVPIVTDGQDSFSLCLYALLGLGLCKSAPLVKKFSFGYVPQWYHDGGPVQVGHSFAISPDCLCSAPACFVQPEGPAENPIPRHHFSAVVSRWRNSQFTPAVLASRGPPSSRC